MLDDTGLRMMELAGKGYCCSQIMVLLALDEMGRENPDMARAAAGLCIGLGDCSGPCGVYTGAALVLGLHAGKGTDMEQTDDKLPLMLEELRDWFVAATEQYGGTTCGAILDGECGQPDKARCGGLVADASAQVREILVANGFDPAQGRGDQ
ncbi:MAG: C_GCAxxG_C_C family protein [Desulfovibrionaceae bacterium]|nr:C_GCAxxG_C_C family protein [Desulfovibrionaceae bacterium]